MRPVLLLDNYDSFTYNLAQYLGELGVGVEVVRNDETDPESIARGQPLALVISPGPCTPEEAGISVAAVTQLAGRLPILGVCLGHQAIAVAYGARVHRAGQVVHGKTSMIEHDQSGVFAGLASPTQATRYHSLVVNPETVPPQLRVNARTEDGVIMGLHHRELAVHGVQFHPESVLSVDGRRMVANFLELALGWQRIEA